MPWVSLLLALWLLKSNKTQVKVSLGFLILYLFFPGASGLPLLPIRRWGGYPKAADTMIDALRHLRAAKLPVDDSAARFLIKLLAAQKDPRCGDGPADRGGGRGGGSLATSKRAAGGGGRFGPADSSSPKEIRVVRSSGWGGGR